MISRMVKTQKTITREILEEELATRANAKLKTEIGSIIRGELDDIIDEYGLSDTESLEKLLAKTA